MSDITPTTVRSIERDALLVAETSEGAQEMLSLIHISEPTRPY